MTPKAEAIIQRLEAALAPRGVFRLRAMFGGHGLYLDDSFFGLIAYETLYLKTDELTRAEYVTAESTPFSFESGRKGLVVTSWVDKALDAARRAKTAKPQRRSRKPKALSL
jgi:DNA transformation protein